MEIRELTEKDLTDYQSDIIGYICDNLMMKNWLKKSIWT